MRAKEISVHNIKGIEDITVRPRALTLVKGRNGSGKTSFLDALRSLLRGGHDPHLLRRGAEEGFVRVTLEDGTVITKTITAAASRLEMVHPQFGKVSKAQTIVDQWVDSLGSDPLALLSIPEHKQAEYLAESMPIYVSVEQLSEAAGRPVVPAKGNGLDQIEAVRKELYTERTEVNRTAKDKRATASQLRATLPPDEPAGEDLAALRVEQSDLVEERETRRAQVAASREKAVREITKRTQADIDRIRREAEAAIAEVNDNAQHEERAEREAETALLNAVADEYGPRIETLTNRIGQAEERATARTRAQRTREILDESERDAAAAEERSKAISAGLDRLDALKLSTLASLPLPGVEIRDGLVFVDGVPVRHVNQRRQFEVCMQLAALRAGDFGLMVIDRLESFHSEEELVSVVTALGMQVIGGRVDDCDFHEETFEAAPAA